MDKHGIRYQNFEAERLVICNGVHETRGFVGFRFVPLKGETLQIQCDYQEG